jgi:hypothetical protein
MHIECLITSCAARGRLLLDGEEMHNETIELCGILKATGHEHSFFNYIQITFAIQLS